MAVHRRSSAEESPASGHDSAVENDVTNGSKTKRSRKRTMLSTMYVDGQEVHKRCSLKYIAEKFQVGETIGEGAYAKVKVAVNNVTGEKVAMKITNKTAIADYAKAHLHREALVMSQLDHPNICKILEVIESMTYYIIIMELIDGEELLDYILRQGHLDEREAHDFTLQILSAMQCMNNMGIVHRDLKPENIMVNTQSRIKVIDFGLSNAFEPNQKLVTCCGSPVYAAPELLVGDPYDGPASDMWSLGISIFAMLTGKLPFCSRESGVLLAKMKNREYEMSVTISVEARNFVHGLLTVNPEERTALGGAMDHPWIKEKRRSPTKELQKVIDVCRRPYPLTRTTSTLSCHKILPRI